MELRTVLQEVPQSGKDPLTAALGRVAEIQAAGQTVLKWGIVARDGSTLLLETSVADTAMAPTPWVALPEAPPPPEGLKTAFVIPTGVGARYGGYLADAGPLSRAIASLCSVAVIHPNVANGADFYAADDSLYTEGSTLDAFLLGEIRLATRRVRRVGVLIEQMPQAELDPLLYAVDAVRVTHGIDVCDVVVTRGAVEACARRTPLGHFQGFVRNPEVLFDGASRLRAHGAEAIAVVTRCNGAEASHWESHYRGETTNPVGSLEALMSRYLTRALGIPAAHAPAYHGGISVHEGWADPRASAELASKTGLPCVLIGLARAPRLTRAGGMGVEDLDAIVVPYGAAGGVPAVGAASFGVPLVAVRDNECCVGLTADALEGPTVEVVANSAELLSWVVCRRAGISWEIVRRVDGRIPNVNVCSP